MSSYNLESVQEMAGGDQEFVKVVVQTFLEEIPADLFAMNEAIAGDNAGMAYQYAHKMKPNFLMFGLMLLPEIKIIEDWSKSGKDKKEVEEAALTINTTVNKAISELATDFDL